MPTAAELAKECEREIKRLLRTRHINPAVKARQVSRGGLEFWKAELAPRQPVKLGLDGEWTLHVMCKFENDVGGAGGHLADASIGLNVDHPVFGEEPVNFVRYDFEGWGVRKAHVHVMQPAPLGSNVHWLLPDRYTEPWQPGPVLEFLLSEELHDDLLASGWAQLTTREQ